MKAMIFAAGLGTRLRPLTDKIPKALITIKNTTLLETVINKLKKYSVDQIIINTHHHAQQIENFLKEKNYFGLHIEISYEKELLDTGGGLKKAAWFFRDEEYFLIHNVDIISDINLTEMINHHISHQAIATLAVQKRETSRQLLFDQDMKLCGWKNLKTGKIILSDTDTFEKEQYAFSGIHVLSPAVFSYFPDKQVFSIIDSYLTAAQNGAYISGWIPSLKYWMDLGKPDQLQKAAQLITQFND